MLNYKKLAFWVSIVAALTVVAIIVIFAFGGSGQDDIKANLSEIAVDNLDLNANPGVGVMLDF